MPDSVKRSARLKVAAAITTLSEDAYLAGMIDGEGSICIYKKPQGHLGMDLCIATTDRRFAEHLSKVYGFSLCATRAYLKNPNWSQAHRLQIRGPRAASLLRRALPYLILKRPQAELAIEFVGTTKAGGLAGRPSRSLHYDPEEIERRSAMREEMMCLNKTRRGHGAP